MIKKLSLVICLSLSSIGLLASGKTIYKKGWIDFNKNGQMDVYENPKAPLEDRVKDLLSQMSVEEKTCQLATLYGSGRVLQDTAPTSRWKSEVWKDGIANIDEQANGVGALSSTLSYPYINSVKNRQRIQRWFVEETRLGIPVDFTNEGIRGLNHDRATMFPAQCAQGASWDKELISEIARIEAKEARTLGYTNIYSPILDIAQDPRWGRLEKPAQELKAFAKTRELQPGESQTLTMQIPVRELASYDEANSQWLTEAGTYTFRFGFSSRDIKASLPLKLAEYTEKTTNALTPQQPLNLLKQ